MTTNPSKIPVFYASQNQIKPPSMAISRSVFLFFVVVCSWASAGHAQGGGGGAALPCIQKLMPCQPYLKGSSNPPASCCVPLKEILTDDSQCLCAVFNNPELLKGLNVTIDDALGLAKACGVNADPSVCKKAATPTPGSPSTPASPSTNSSSSTPPPKSAATVISYGGGAVMGAAAIFSVFIVSAF